jgi:hypothetical protein
MPEVIVSASENESSPINRPWIVFPEIIGVSIVAIYAPLYLVQMFMAGHVVWSVMGLAGWAVGVATTVVCFKHRLYLLAFCPMLLMLGVGLLIHHTLFPK